MSKFHKTIVSMFGVLLLAGFTFLKAQSPVTVTMSEVKGQAGVYTMTVSPMNSTVAASLNELSATGRMIEVLEMNEQTGVVKVKASHPNLDAESIKNYVTSYVDYRLKPSSKPETR